MEKYLQKLKNVCAGKKVVIYCNGTYFDSLCDCFNLSDYFDIRGVSDLRYENSKEIEYRGFQAIKPSDLSKTDCDFILIASPNYSNLEKFLLSLGVKASFLPLYLEKDRVNVQDNYAKVLARLRNADKIRVLFVCEENSKWSYSKLYEKFMANSRFEVLPIVLFPIVTKSRLEFTQKENAEFFKEIGIPTVDGYDYEKQQNKDLMEFKPDIVFYQQPWYLEGVNHPEKVSEYALTCLVPYGYTTLSPDEWGSYLVKRVYSSLWRFFSESPYHNEFYKKAAGMSDENLFAVGSLKLDCYREPCNNANLIASHSVIASESEAIQCGNCKDMDCHASYEARNDAKEYKGQISQSEFCLGNDSVPRSVFARSVKDEAIQCGSYKDMDCHASYEARNDAKEHEQIPQSGCVVLWAPHHSINNDGLRMSTFKENHREFLEFAKEHNEFSIVLKPHPALRNACINSGIDYDKFICEWNDLPNTSVYDKGNYFDLFKTSNVMVTDCSSFLAEYFPSGKPIIFLNRPDRAHFDEFGEKLRAGFYEANNFDEAKAFLLQKQDTLKQKRLEIIEKYIYFPKKTAGEIILEHIYSVL